MNVKDNICHPSLELLENGILMRFKRLLLALWIFGAMPAFADETLSVSLLGGGAFPASPESLRDQQRKGVAFGVRALYPLNQTVRIGASYNYLRLEPSSGGNAAVFQPVSAELQFRLSHETSALVPYLLLGMGPSLNRYTFASGEKEWFNLHGKMGLGAEYAVNDQWFVGLEGVMYLIAPAETQNDMLYPAVVQALIGYRWDIPSRPIRPKTSVFRPAPVPVTSVEPAPSLPEPSAPVVSPPAQAAPVTPEVIVPPPSAEEQTQIELDRIMEQIKNQKLRPIHFETAKAVINPKSIPTVNEVGNVLAQYKSLKVRIEGHTDNVGRARANQILSQQRADTVRSFLIKEWGLNPEKLEAIGYGDSQPIAENTTLEGRAANRRVEFKVVR